MDDYVNIIIDGNENTTENTKNSNNIVNDDIIKDTTTFKSHFS